MKIANILTLSLITYFNTSIFNNSLAIEISDDDIRSYRVSKKINDIFEYTGFIITPNAEDTLAIIKRKGKYSIIDRYELYSRGDLLLGTKPEYGVTLESINPESIMLNLVHNLNQPSEERRKVYVKYINTNDLSDNYNKISNVNNLYYIHAEEVDINSFAAAYLRSKTLVFSPSVDINKILSVPYKEFVNKEDIFDWAINYLSSVGYQVLTASKNIVVIRYNVGRTLLNIDNIIAIDTEVCNQIKTKGKIRVDMREAKLVAYINAFSKSMNNSSIVSWPSNVSNLRITIHGNKDVDSCELFSIILNENNLKLESTDKDFIIVNIEQTVKESESFKK